MADVKTITPNQLAAKLAGKDNADKVAKAFVRPFLRKHFTRQAAQKGSSWYLTPEQVKAVSAAWRKAQKG